MRRLQSPFQFFFSEAFEEQPPEQELKDPAQEQEQNSYEMKYVNGGFNGSVDIQPGVAENLGKVSVSINIFGGGEKKKITISTPPKIKKMLQAYQIAVHKQDPSADKIKKELEAYYLELKNTIARNFAPLMKELDGKAKQVIIKSMQEINSKY